MALSDRFGPLISANHVSLFLEKYKYKIKNKQNKTKK